MRADKQRGERSGVLRRALHSTRGQRLEPGRKERKKKKYKKKLSKKGKDIDGTKKGSALVLRGKCFV